MGTVNAANIPTNYHYRTMSYYIKLSTLEYPRHAGDIEIDPAGAQDYARVEETPPPSYDYQTQRCYGGQPIQENGVWRMTWGVHDMTPEELEYERLVAEELQANAERERLG
jgi:hypothetical protein